MHKIFYSRGILSLPSFWARLISGLGLWPLFWRFQSWRYIPMGIRLRSFISSLFLLFFLLVFPITNVHAQEPTGTPSPTQEPTGTPSPTWEPLYQTPTPKPTQNNQCPAVGTPIVGYKTVTPSAAWMLACSQCLVNQAPTVTDIPVPTTVPYVMQGACSNYGNPSGCVTITTSGGEMCQCGLNEVSPTPTPTITPLPTAGPQTDHYYLVNIPYSQFTHTQWGGLGAATWGYTGEWSVPGLQCGGDDQMRAIASDFSYDIVIGKANESYLKIFQSFGAGNLGTGFRTATGALGAHVIGDGRQCLYTAINTNTPTYCDILAQMEGRPYNYQFRNADAAQDPPTNRFNEYWHKFAVGSSWVVRQEFTALCYGDEEPVEVTPTPTPTSIPGYCSVIEGEDEGGSITDVGVLPIIRVGPPSCFTFGGIYIPLGWAQSLAQLAGVAIPDQIGIAPINVCFRGLSFGEIGFLGVSINIDLLILITSGISAIMFVFKS